MGTRSCRQSAVRTAMLPRYIAMFGTQYPILVHAGVADDLELSWAEKGYLAELDALVPLARL